MRTAPATTGVQRPWLTAGDLCAEIHETHTGLVILVADKAYKVKKPIATDFLDFSSVKRRERACEDEVAL